MRAALSVMSLFFVLSVASASQGPGAFAPEPEPLTMESRVEEYRNMVIAAWVLSSLVAVVGTAIVGIQLFFLMVIPGLMTGFLVLTAASLLWLLVVRAVSHRISNTIRESPGVYAGTSAEKQYRHWRSRMLAPWLMTAVPAGLILVFTALVGLILLG